MKFFACIVEFDSIVWKISAQSDDTFFIISRAGSFFFFVFLNVEEQALEKK